MAFISTQNIMASSRTSVMQAQVDLARVQQELSSGNKADVGLSLGSASSQLLSLNLQASRLQGYVDTNGVATTRLTATTSAISTLQTTATNFLSTLSTANPASLSNSALLTTAQANLSAMTSVLNTTVGGQYIFGGINADTQPVTAYTTSPPSANKQAVDASFAATFGFSQTSASATSVTAGQMQSYLDTSFASLFSASGFSGSGAWSAASNTVTSTQVSPSETANTSVSANEQAFRTLAQAYTMVNEFAGQNLNAAASQVVITRATEMVSSAISGLTAVSANAGVAQNTIADANTRMTSQIDLLTTQSSTMQGVDPTALSISVSSLQTQIQASYDITAKLQKLSMVNYMA